MQMIDRIELNNPRRLYVEGHLFSCLKVFPMFEAVKYVKDINTKEEYIRITDSVGGKCYLDITKRTEGDIFLDVAQIVLMSTGEVKRPPESLVVDLERKKEIAPLFRVGSEVRYE